MAYMIMYAVSEGKRRWEEDCATARHPTILFLWAHTETKVSNVGGRTYLDHRFKKTVVWHANKYGTRQRWRSCPLVATYWRNMLCYSYPWKLTAVLWNNIMWNIVKRSRRTTCSVRLLLWCTDALMHRHHVRLYVDPIRLSHIRCQHVLHMDVPFLGDVFQFYL